MKFVSYLKNLLGGFKVGIKEDGSAEIISIKNHPYNGGSSSGGGNDFSIEFEPWMEERTPPYTPLPQDTFTNIIAALCFASYEEAKEYYSDKLQQTINSIGEHLSSGKPCSISFYFTVTAGGAINTGQYGGYVVYSDSITNINDPGWEDDYDAWIECVVSHYDNNEDKIAKFGFTLVKYGDNWIFYNEGGGPQ